MKTAADGRILLIPHWFCTRLRIICGGVQIEPHPYMIDPSQSGAVVRVTVGSHLGVLCFRSALGLNSEALTLKRSSIRAPQRLAKAMLLHALHSNHRVLRRKKHYPH
jgi:hypothetical protein